VTIILGVALKISFPGRELFIFYRICILLSKISLYMAHIQMSPIHLQGNNVQPVKYFAFWSNNIISWQIYSLSWECLCVYLVSVTVEI